jgi:probable DNA metabolism protein
MVQLVYLHDGSFEGLLSAVAGAVKDAESVQGVYAAAGYVPSLFARTKTITSDPVRAQQLLAYLQNVSGEMARLAINAFLSEDHQAGCHLQNFVRLCLRRGAEALHLHSNDAVRALLLLSRKVNFEAHRLNGMLRFRMLAGGLQYGPFASDHNVIGYCAQHFCRRFANRAWLLHDIGRDFALYWDGEALQPVAIANDITQHVARFGELPADQLTSEELYYQQLWRTFHATITNPDRENTVLQRRFMPRRYWHFLIERQVRP